MNKMSENTIITAGTTFHLLVPGIAPAPVEAELQYNPEDPYAVAVLFHTGQGKVEWMFARDLLADGLLTPSGEGDIMVRPAADDPERVLLELNAPTGFAILSAEAEHIAEFLDLTYDVVQPGEEDLWIDFDRELAKLVASS
ncbi:SsgA family sporulation/cell division regulator [Umezawaea endophytica]|uniref:SsgA family sporulation/cell division regulator n=1 Tax=Umezawaea endophytica TaxID=1654476 RepID=A0A9X2VU57_9PSEU|nr:SsgA family sporulation/cell division regulator [Umezawaea endophytica]MCS7482257.1 SsgA family sporulation/cell division regulator [Umezawaea endophytica]